MEISEKRKRGIQANNNFISFKVWHPEFGTESQPKYIAIKDSGKKYVVKPQVPGAGPMELAYFGFQALYDNNKYHNNPISYGYDREFLALYVEFIDCPTVRGLKNKDLWTKGKDSDYQKYLQKISDLDLQDLNEGNIVVCDDNNLDPFYVIDLGYSRKLLRKNIQAALRALYWYNEELPQNAEALNFLSHSLLKSSS